MLNKTIAKRRCKSIGCEKELRHESSNLSTRRHQSRVKDENTLVSNNQVEEDSIKYIDDSIDNSDLSTDTVPLSTHTSEENEKSSINLKLNKHLSKSVPNSPTFALNSFNDTNEIDTNKVSFVYNVDLYQQNESILAKLNEINSVDTQRKKKCKKKTHQKQQDKSSSHTLSSISIESSLNSSESSSQSSSLSSINEFFNSNLEPLEIKELNDIVKRLSLCSYDNTTTNNNNNNVSLENDTLNIKYENAKRERHLEEERVENDRKRLQEILVLCNQKQQLHEHQINNDEQSNTSGNNLQTQQIIISSSSSSSSCSSFLSTANSNANCATANNYNNQNMYSNNDFINNKLKTIPEHLIKIDNKKQLDLNDNAISDINNDIRFKLILNDHNTHLDTFTVTFFKISDEIQITGETLCKVEYELNKINTILSNDKDNLEQIKNIKKHILDEAKRKHEDLEFQLMELEAKYESHMEDLQNRLLASEQEEVAKKRRCAILQQIKQELFEIEKQKYNLSEKFKLEREQLKRIQVKLLELEENLLNASSFSSVTPSKVHSKNTTPTKSTFCIAKQQVPTLDSPNKIIIPINTRKVIDDNDDYDQVPNTLSSGISISKHLVLAKNELKIEIHRQAKSSLKLNSNRNGLTSELASNMNNIVIENQVATANYELDRQESVTLRQKKKNHQNNTQLVNKETRPLTRYLPVRDNNFDLKQHVETSGHQLEAHSKFIHINKHSSRGYLFKMGKKFKTWNKRWFVFDRIKRTLSYYSDRQELKQRGCVYFQSINEVYVDHMRTIKSLDSKATFVVKTRERDFYFVSPTPEVMRIWVDVIFTGAEGYLEQ